MGDGKGLQAPPSAEGLRLPGGEDLRSAAEVTLQAGTALSEMLPFRSSISERPGDGSEIREGLVSSPQSLLLRKQTTSFPAAGASRRPSPDRRDASSHPNSGPDTEHRAHTSLRKESSAYPH